MSTLNYISAAMEDMTDNEYIRDDKHTARKVHDCLYKWIVDEDATFDSIRDLLNNLKLESFFNNLGFQDLVALTCFEGIAKRQAISNLPNQVIKDSFEELLVFIILHFDINKFCFTYKILKIISFIEIKCWLCVYCTPKQCPNPRLRLELLRLKSDLKIVNEYETSHHDNIISTLCEINDSFSSFKNQGTIKCSAVDLENIMVSNTFNFRVLEYKCPKHDLKKAVVALIKMTNLFVFEVEQEMKDQSRYNVDIVLLSCLNFCGLLSEGPSLHITNKDMDSFADIVCNDPLLQRYVADTLYLAKKAITQYEIQAKPNLTSTSAKFKIKKILGAMISAETRLLSLRLNHLPLYLADCEMNGNTKPIAKHLLYFTIFKNRYFSKMDNELGILEDTNLEYFQYAYLQHQSEYDNFSEISESSEEESSECTEGERSESSVDEYYESFGDESNEDFWG